MSGCSLWPVQSALYGKLSADATLLGLVAGVYNAVATNQAYAYVVLADASEGGFDTFGKLGRIVKQEIQVWSQYQGNYQADTIMDRIAKVLDRVALTITGHEHVTTLHKGSTVSLQGDGLTRVGRMSFEVWVKES